MTAFTKYSMRSLASSPSIGSPTNVWISRHSVIAARPAVIATSRNLPNGCSATLANAPALVHLLAADLTAGELDGEEAEHEVQHPAGDDAGAGQRIAPRERGPPSARRQWSWSCATRYPRRAPTRTANGAPLRVHADRGWGMIGTCQPLSVIVDDDPAARAAREIARHLADALERRGPRHAGGVRRLDRPGPARRARRGAPALAGHRRVAGRRARRHPRATPTATPTSSPASPARST